MKMQPTQPIRLVAIVGIGALGSHVLQLLRNEPNVRFKIIDAKRVTTKNVLSQFHSRTMVGRLKVDSFKQTALHLFGETPKISSAIGNPLTAQNVDVMLDNADVVIECVDNTATRRLIQDFCWARAIPCLHGGVAANAEFGQIGWDAEFMIDEDNNVDAPTCENGAHLPFLALVGAWMAQAAHGYLRDGKKIGFAVYPRGARAVGAA